MTIENSTLAERAKLRAVAPAPPHRRGVTDRAIVEGRSVGDPLTRRRFLRAGPDADTEVSVLRVYDTDRTTS